MRHLLRILPLLAFVAILPLSPGTESRTEAGSIVVDSTADSGNGSFRQALTDAGNNPGADTITFDPATFPPQSPATIQPVTNYVVEGAAASDPLTIDATGAGVVFDMQFADSGDAGFHFRPTGAFTGLTMRNFAILNFHPDSGGNGLEIGFQVTDVSGVLIDDMTFSGHDGHGIALIASGLMSDVTITNITSSGNTAHGILLNADSMDEIEIAHNEVHLNDGHGIEVKANSSSVPSTVLVADNDVSDNDLTGIGIYTETVGPHVTISRNRTSENGGLGIDLGGGDEDSFGVTANDSGDGDDGPNGLLNFPVINGVATGVVGTACRDCTVELFIADADPSGHGEGFNYVATGQADAGGSFSVSGCGLTEGIAVTATATDASGNTSEFAENYVLPSTPPCVVTYDNGDNDCDSDVDARDALVSFIHEIGTPQIPRGDNCPGIGTHLLTVNSTGPGPDFFGDVNCDGDITTADPINILQFAANLELNPAPADNCTPIGDPLPD